MQIISYGLARIIANFTLEISFDWGYAYIGNTKAKSTPHKKQAGI